MLKIPTLMLCCAISWPAYADSDLPLPADTARVIDVDEIVVVASPKENVRFRRQPLSVSMLSRQDREKQSVNALKDLTGNVPNFFMPDYGSRITSAVYIRGIGSRINTPAVGLYVDNVPYADKSSYDFSFTDVERIDVLRGPQATLYGRNAMGGLIRVYTPNPLSHHGTDIRLGASSHNYGRKASFTTYLHPTYGLGIALSGFYEGDDGFFKNNTTGRNADASDAGGGRLKLAYRPSEWLKIDWTTSYEYSDEGACPYYYEGTLTEGGDETAEPYPNYVGRITSNRPSQYRRHVLNTGLGIEWNIQNRMTLSSITAFQYLDDRLFMDQDFIKADIFSLEQKQHMQTVSEEVALKSQPGKRWEWTSGAFFMYQAMRTDCPVIFYGDGISYLNTQLDGSLSGVAGMPPLSVAFSDERLTFNSRMRTPSLNAALFHQSTYHDLFLKGLSLTVGLRLDYDFHRQKLHAGTDAPVNYRFTMASMGIDADLQNAPTMTGDMKNDTWQVLPKLALQYDLKNDAGNVYLTVSKGYRSGGYNIQQYSDLAQTLLRREMMGTVADYSTETIRNHPRLPEASKDNIIGALNGVMENITPAAPDIRSLYYKPEQSWNYEAGTHLNLAGHALQLDVAFFLMNTRDQQLAVFAESSFGRRTINAGKSRSCGMEVGLKSALLDNRLSLSANYGYTRAVFTDFCVTTEEGTAIDFENNRVPFVPEHTLGLAADYRLPLKSDIIQAIGVGIGMNGTGRIYWNEANSAYQDFYATLNAHVTAELGQVTLSLWGKNLTNSRYNTFYFESMNRGYTQRSIPFHMGIDLRIHL